MRHECPTCHDTIYIAPFTTIDAQLVQRSIDNGTFALGHNPNAAEFDVLLRDAINMRINKICDGASSLFVAADDVPPEFPVPIHPNPYATVLKLSPEYRKILAEMINERIAARTP